MQDVQKLEEFFKKYEEAHGVCLDTFEKEEEEVMFNNLMDSFLEIEKEIENYGEIDEKR